MMFGAGTSAFTARITKTNSNNIKHCIISVCTIEGSNIHTLYVDPCLKGKQGTVLLKKMKVPYLTKSEPRANH